MKTFEIITLISILISIILRICLVPGASALIVLSFMMLYLLYFPFGFLLINNIPLRRVFSKSAYQSTTIWKIIGAVLAGFALSIAVAGVLFKIQSWPGSSILFTTGFTFLTPIFCLTVFHFYKTRADYYKKLSIRIFFICVTGLLMILVPEEIKVKVFFRDHPNFVNALLNAFDNPDDPEAWKKVDEEREIMKEEINNPKDD